MLPNSHSKEGRPAYKEPAFSTPVVETADVVVCGGGPAGVAAALASARAGARTILIETHGCLGGVWTTGLLSWVLDAEKKPGIMAEIIRILDSRGARAMRVPGGKGFAYDPEQMKLLLEQLCLACGVHVRYYTKVVATMRSGENARLEGVITESKSGREAWKAKVVVDATGDGDVGALAGCAYLVGRPGDGAVQPASLIALLAGIRFSEVEPFVGGCLDEPKQRLFEKLKALGVEPSNSVPLLVRIYDDLFALCSNHEYGVKADDAASLTRATIHARAEIGRTVDALRRIGPPWHNLRLVSTAAQIGIREGRRILGKYVINDDDIIVGTCHEDAICRVRSPIDVHSINGDRAKGIEENKSEAQPYDIPFRALIARDITGLLLAGRCISGDFLAHSSYRVTGNAVVTGEAAGLAAAISARTGVETHDLSWEFVRKETTTHPDAKVI